MTAFTVQAVPAGGVDLGALVAVSASDTVTVTSTEMGGWDANKAVYVCRNGGAGATVVSVDGQTGVSVAAGGLFVCPLNTGYGGKTITITHSVLTSVVGGAFQLP